MLWPAVADIESFAKTVLAVSAIAAGVSAMIAKRLRARKAEREMRALEAKAIRYLMDSMHHVLDAIHPGEGCGRPMNLTELTRQNILIRAVRSELWTADGNAIPAEVQAEIKRVLTRTQAIRLVKDRGGSPSWDVVNDEKDTDR